MLPCFCWQMEKNPPVKTKRPSRRHRRRPSNLLQEYSRRQRNHIWLETHIWHAKRFHMTEAWGYKIPLHPNDKGVRAAYRAAARDCLLHVGGKQACRLRCSVMLQRKTKYILRSLMGCSPAAQTLLIKCVSKLLYHVLVIPPLIKKEVCDHCVKSMILKCCLFTTGHVLLVLCRGGRPDGFYKAGYPAIN